MLNALKKFAVLAVVLGLMSGCSSNKASDDMSDTVDTSGSSGVAVEDTSVEMEDDNVMSNVPTVFYFEFDSAVLSSEARSALLLHAQDLKNAGRSVRLEGHADERGSREYNMALGERRANAVRDFLVLQGVSRSQLETVSYGEERPIETGSSAYAWSKNRRVELAK